MVNRTYKRSNRVGPVLREVICEVLMRRIQDPRIKGLIVTDVDVSPDLRNCAVYYYCTGENPDIEAVQAGLESATGLIRKEMSSASTMRYTPKNAKITKKKIRFKKKQTDEHNLLDAQDLIVIVFIF